jgi:hypothetical protein
MVVILLQNLNCYYIIHEHGQVDSLVRRHWSNFSLYKVPVFTNSSVRNEPKHFSGTISCAFSIIHPFSRSIRAALGVRVVKETWSVLVSLKNYFTLDVSLIHLSPNDVYFNSKLISLKLTQTLVQRIRSVL